MNKRRNDSEKYEVSNILQINTQHNKNILSIQVKKRIS